jgi:hypothetical protein
VKDFRDAWHVTCCGAGEGRMVCPKCTGDELLSVDAKNCCPECLKQSKGKELKYTGKSFTIFGARRSATWCATVFQKSSHDHLGPQTGSVSDRYDIVSESDLRPVQTRWNAQ